MKYGEIFPNKFSIFIFVLYMALFVNQSLIVSASQEKDRSYTYNIVLVVFLTEILKLISTFLIYLQSENIYTVFYTLKDNLKLCWYYLVPSFLYCLYNNLSFINLSHFDPTTYLILLQLRVIITGILYQFIFKRRLTSLQWLSLFILMIGCMVKHLTVSGHTVIVSKESSSGHWFYQNVSSIYNKITSLSTLFILIQVFCSCMAGVYNEKLLKHIGAKVPVLAQNVFMCADSVFFNAVGIAFWPQQQSLAFGWDSFQQVLHWNVMLIIANNAAAGIVTAFFLKTLNSILKTFASAMEPAFTAVLAWMIFGTTIGPSTVISIGLVGAATVIYSQNPVKTTVPDSDLKETETKSILTV